MTNPTEPADDTRKCPLCAELIKKRAVFCKHCKSEVSSAFVPAPTINAQPPASAPIIEGRTGSNSLPLILCSGFLLLLPVMALFVTYIMAPGYVTPFLTHPVANLVFTAQLLLNALFCGLLAGSGFLQFSPTQKTIVKVFTGFYNPGLIGTVDKSTAKVNFRSSHGAVGSALLELDGEQLRWTIENITPGRVTSGEQFSSECYLPKNDALERGLEPSVNYWKEHLIAKAPLESESEATAEHLPVQESCRNFVQQFYNDYLSTANDLNLCHEQYAHPERNPFSAELVRLLKEDRKAVANAKPGEELDVGLDFDPVLNGNGSPEGCTVGKLTAKGDHHLVEIHHVCNGKKEVKPSLVAELTRRNGKWLFVNFIYPGFEDGAPSSDLISQLRSLHPGVPKENRTAKESPTASTRSVNQ